MSDLRSYIHVVVFKSEQGEQKNNRVVEERARSRGKYKISFSVIGSICCCMKRSQNRNEKRKQYNLLLLF